MTRRLVGRAKVSPQKKQAQQQSKSAGTCDGVLEQFCSKAPPVVVAFFGNGKAPLWEPTNESIQSKQTKFGAYITTINSPIACWHVYQNLLVVESGE